MIEERIVVKLFFNIVLQVDEVVLLATFTLCVIVEVKQWNVLESRHAKR